MEPNAFIGDSEHLTEAKLKKALGESKALWDQLKTELAEKHDVTTEEWKSYSARQAASRI